MCEADKWAALLGVPPDAPTLTVCQAFEALAVKLAPKDLATLPFYAMPSSALDLCLQRMSRHTGGWYHDWLSLWMQPYIANWRGWGPGVIVHDVGYDSEAVAKKTRELCAARGMDCDDEYVAAIIADVTSRGAPLDVTCGVLVHELAHALESVAAGVFASGASSPSAQATNDNYLTILATSVHQEAAPAPRPDQHGLQFTRVAVHLDTRLSRLGGVNIGSSFSVAGPMYSLPPYEQCAEALGVEPLLMADASFHDILSAPLPPAFAKCGATQGNAQ